MSVNRALDDVAAALPPAGQPLTMKQIHQRVDRWAPTTIKQALLTLVQRGVATRIQEMPPRFARAQ